MKKLIETESSLFFVIPAPYQVRDELQRESRKFRHLWTPAFSGVTHFWAFGEIITGGY